jgi:amino acid transporter
MIKTQKISVFQLAMITVAYIASIRVSASMAEYGFSCIFYYLLAALCFLVPSALISAELATTWPQRGGVYVWVKEALGPRWGFMAIWLQFLSNIINLPAYLTFLATIAAYAIFPDLANNKYFLMSFVLIVFWGATFASFRGMRTAGWINTFGVFTGTILPVSIIVILGIIWLIKGDPIQTTISWKAIIPHFNAIGIRDVVFLAGLLYAFTGMETSGAHALDVKDTQKNYPRAIFLAAIIIPMIGLTALAIAIVVPKSQLSIVAGLMQTFSIFFTQFHITWAIPVLALMLVFGGIGTLNSNIIGPSKGLFGSATGGEIPPILTKLNKHDMPINMFIFQGIVVTLLISVFLLIPTVSGSYWLIMGIVCTVYLIMYVLMFISGIVLRYKQPNIMRPYKAGNNLVMWILSAVGLVSTLFGIVVSLFPPSQLNVGSLLTYELSLFTGIIVFIGLGMIIFALRKPHWAIVGEEITHEEVEAEAE